MANLEQVRGYLHQLKLKKDVMLGELRQLNSDIDKIQYLVDEVEELRKPPTQELVNVKVN